MATKTSPDSPGPGRTKAAKLYNPTHRILLAALPDFERVPTGWAPIDVFTNGGIPRGATTLISGAEATGKTTLAEFCLAHYLRQFPNEWGLYINSDNKLDKQTMLDRGIALNRMTTLSPSTAEEAWWVAYAEAQAQPKLGVIIVDSLASFSPAKEEIGGEEMALAARLNNKSFRKFTALQLHRLSIGNPLSLLVVNQTRWKTGLFPTVVLPGGNQQRFQAALWVKFEKADEHIDKATQIPIAKTFRYTLIKNEGGATGFPGETRMATNPHGRWLPNDIIDEEFTWLWATRLGVLQNKGAKGSEYQGEHGPREFWVTKWEDSKESYALVKEATIKAFREWRKGERKISFLQEPQTVKLQQVTAE